MKLNNYLEKNYSKTAIQGYKNIIERFTDYTTEAETATYQEILNYISYLRQKELHPKSIRNHLFGIKIYYNWLITEEKRQDHPARNIHLKDKINRSIDIESLYTKEQLEEYYKSCNPKNKKLLERDKVIISLLINQALTVLEISQLDKNNLDLEKGLIHIKGNAKNNARTLNLEVSQIMLLHNYINENATVTERSRSLVLNLSGTRINPHSIAKQLNRMREERDKLLPIKIRQSVIANLLKSNNELRIVQVFAGHKKASSTESYKQTGLEELKLAIIKNHPLG